jgi:hypothetical protein
MGLTGPQLGVVVRDMAHWQLSPVERALKGPAGRGPLVGQQEKQVAPLCGAASLVPSWEGQAGITGCVLAGLVILTKCYASCRSGSLLLTRSQNACHKLEATRAKFDRG